MIEDSKRVWIFSDNVGDEEAYERPAEVFERARGLLETFLEEGDFMEAALDRAADLAVEGCSPSAFQAFKAKCRNFADLLDPSRSSRSLDDRCEAVRDAIKIWNEFNPERKIEIRSVVLYPRLLPREGP